MQLKQILLAGFASIALVSAVAIPEPATTAAIPCGCTNDCIIGCAGKPDCICPQYCDPKYECPVPTTTTTYTPIRPTATCGCLNDCIVGCPDLRLCRCAAYCDPKYECPTTTIKTTTKKTTTTTSIKPTPTCGCTNDCFVNCPPGENCICPLFCDPKYACPTLTTKTIKTTKKTTTTTKPVLSTRSPITITRITPIPLPTTVPCGCHNDCTIACGGKAGCVCPAYCDPKYSCAV